MPYQQVDKSCSPRSSFTVPKDLLEKAKEMVVKNNISVRQAAEKFAISKSTLHDYISGKHQKKVGGQTLLSEAEESHIVKQLLTLSERGFPLDILELRMLVKARLDRQGTTVARLPNNLPGIDWAYSFLRRHWAQLNKFLTQNIKYMQAKNEGSGASNVEAENGDGEFEPTVEMLVNDFDDERTLDEEEALEERENREEEINNLTKEQNMPIEQLLAIYGAYPPKDEGDLDERNGDLMEGENGNTEEEPNEEEVEGEEGDDGDAAFSRSSTSDENMNSTDLDKEVKLVEEVKPERRKKEKQSELVHLYPELEANGDSSTGATARSLRSGSRQQSEDEEEEGEEGSGEEEEDWRKTIMIGSAYQAQVPEGLQAYGDTPPYENEDRLLWEPGMVTPEQVENYLNTFGKRNKSSQGVASLPLGTHVRDDEYALHLLLQCGYNVDEALRRHKMNPNKPASQMTLWSEEECRNFENGLRTYGKDFHLIQQNKVRTRSVGELVQFYYLWKKTERHDVFATKTRIEKKKYIVHPGTTDYMDRFLDEGESALAFPPSYVREAPGVHALLYGKCPPGVAPPIPSSTIAFVNATTPSSLPLQETKALGSSPTPSLASINNNNNHHHHRHLHHHHHHHHLHPTTHHFQPPTTSSSSFTSSSTSSPLARSRSSSPRTDQAVPHIAPPNVETGSVSAGVRPGPKLPPPPSGRGTKRPISPGVDMKVSLSQASPMNHSSLGGLCVDSSSIPKAETVAL